MWETGFKTFSHKEKFCNQLHAIFRRYRLNLFHDFFTEKEQNEFREGLQQLGRQIHEEAGMVGMHAIYNYIGTEQENNFGHDFAPSAAASHMKMLVHRMWSGIGEWQY